MNLYEEFKALNKRLIRGEAVPFFRAPGRKEDHRISPHDDRPLHYPRIGIYNGAGASHSWMWFVEIFDGMGFYDLVFLDERAVRTGGLEGLDVLAVSGGDTFAIAEALGREGARRLSAFIRGGGLYLGSCAGAYLPLHSSKAHLKEFNYVRAKISNLTAALPDARCLREKFCTPYGCSFVFHPVRETLELTPSGVIPFEGIGSFLAPLYGGPPMVPLDGVEVLATYSGFTDKTLFLVDKDTARNTVLHKAAAVRKTLGAGHLYLFGPHFEHPGFPIANQLLAEVIYWEAGRERPLGRTDEKGPQARTLLRNVKREVSNARIVAAGLETMPVQWKIGNKVYDPTKIRVFLEAVWKRLRRLERRKALRLVETQENRTVVSAARVASILRDMRRDMKGEGVSPQKAAELFRALNQTCTFFLESYFSAELERFMEEPLE